MGDRGGEMRKRSLAQLLKMIVIKAPAQTAFGMDLEPDRTNLSPPQNKYAPFSRTVGTLCFLSVSTCLRGDVMPLTGELERKV